MSLSMRSMPYEGTADDVAFMAPTVAAPLYEPDLAAYMPDARNDKIAELKRQLESGKVDLTLSVACHDGRREKFKLSAADTKTYLEASLAGDIDKRDALVSDRILERRLNAAAEIYERVSKAPAGSIITPADDAALREFGAIVTRETAEHGERVLREADGSCDVLRPKFIPWARKAATLAREGKTAQLREDWEWGNTGSFGADSYFVAPTDREYLPRGGPTFRQQLISNVWDAMAKNYYAWTHDPVIREGCAILTEFPLGRGVQLIAKDPKLQNVLDDYTKRTRFDRMLSIWTNSLSRDGELFIRKIRDGQGGLDPVTLDPSTVWEIVTDGENVQRVFYYVQRYQTRYQYDSSAVPDARIQYIERTIAADDVIFVKINADAHDVRGRSDIFPALGWAKRMRDYVDAEVQKARAHAAYQWKITVQGGAADVQRVAASIPGTPPAPGSSWVTNDKVTTEALPSGVTGSGPSGQGSTYELLLNQIALAFGLPKDYFGVSSRGSRATALVAADPASKRFEDRQNIIKSGIVEPLITAMIQEARAHGLLDGVEDFTWRASFPAIIKADAQTRSTLLRIAKGEGAISHKTMSEELIGELDMEDYDYTGEQQQIKTEIGTEGWNLSAKDSESVKRGLPSKTDPAFDPGEVPNPAIAGAVGGPVADGGDAGNASPSSAKGAAKIHDEVGAHESKIVEAMAVLKAAGAIVIRP